MTVYVAARPVMNDEGGTSVDLIGVFASPTEAHKAGVVPLAVTLRPFVFACELGQAYDWRHLLDNAEQPT